MSVVDTHTVTKHIDDKLMNDVAPKDRDIAMVFQNYALYPHMTVYENMAFSLHKHTRHCSPHHQGGFVSAVMCASGTALAFVSVYFTDVNIKEMVSKCH